MERKQLVKLILFPVILIIILWVLLFSTAGTISYWQAWLVWGCFSLITVIIGMYFIKKNPSFLKKRSTLKGSSNNIKTPIIFKLYYFGFIIPGIDHRFHWSEEMGIVSIISLLFFGLGYLFIFYVFNVNMYASTKIQVEKKQQIISNGPYNIVRHPMYTGMIIMSLSFPLALGSIFGLIPMLFIIPTLIYRIRGEEQLLKHDLDGYESYCNKVKYRLIPFFW